RDPALSPRYEAVVPILDPGPAIVDLALEHTAERRLIVHRRDGSPVTGTRFEVLQSNVRESGNRRWFPLSRTLYSSPTCARAGTIDGHQASTPSPHRSAT